MKNLLVWDNRVFNNMYSFNNIAHTIGRYLIAGVLLLSGVSKIIDPWPMIETLKLVAHLPEEYLITISAILPIIEITLGITLILKVKPKLVLLLTLVLFAAFFLFSVYGTIVGLKNDCGCFGSIVKSDIGWWMIIRNLFLLSILLLLIKKNRSTIN